MDEEMRKMAITGLWNSLKEAIKREYVDFIISAKFTAISEGKAELSSNDIEDLISQLDFYQESLTKTKRRE